MSLPGAGDTVFANKTVSVDQVITVTSLNTGAGSVAVTGGPFTIDGGRTVNANVIAGTTPTQ